MFRSGFFKSVTTLLSGSATAQLILLLANFLMARWYGPELVGEFRVFVPGVFIVALIANGGYELAIMMPTRDRDAYAILKLSSRILFVIFLLLLPVGVFFKASLSDLFNVPSLAFWAMFWPVSIAMEGGCNSLHQFLVRKKQYRKLSIILLTYAAVYSAMALAGTQIWFSVHVFYIAWISAQAVKLALYLAFYFNEKSKDQKMLQAEMPSQNLAWRYWQYPAFHLGSGFFNTTSKESVAPLLSALYGSTVAGLYSMAFQVLFLPMRFLSQSVTTVFYQRIARAREIGEEQVKRETLNTLFFLLLVSALPTFILALFGADFFAWLFGEEWRDAGTYIKWLAAFAVVASVASPLTSLVNVKFKLGWFFLFNVALLLTRVGAVALGGYMALGAEMTIELYGWAAFAGATVLVVWMLQLAGIFKRSKNDSAGVG